MVMIYILPAPAMPLRMLHRPSKSLNYYSMTNFTHFISKINLHFLFSLMHFLMCSVALDYCNVKDRAVDSARSFLRNKELIFFFSYYLFISSFAFILITKLISLIATTSPNGPAIYSQRLIPAILGCAAAGHSFEGSAEGVGGSITRCLRYLAHGHGCVF